MSLERRIEALEKSFGTEPSPAEEHLEERRRIIAELEALRPDFEEKMAREEAEGNFTRRRALEELEASCKERIRQRTSPHSP